MTGTFNVAEAMNAFLKRFSIEGPDRKVCGLFGYTAFDAVRYFENIPVMEAHHEENDAPDMLYILYKYVLVFNHFKNELTLVELMQSGENSGLQEIETLIKTGTMLLITSRLPALRHRLSAGKNIKQWCAKASVIVSVETFSRSC